MSSCQCSSCQCGSQSSTGPLGFRGKLVSITQPVDLGTPPSRSEAMVTLTIDGREVTAPRGTSIMRAAFEAGIAIPKLCATDQLASFGSCRLCLVQIDGRRGFPASCTTPVEEGMQVRTQSTRLADLRRGVMELYISDHPLDCLTCTANGNCELQDMAGVVGLRAVRYGMAGENHFDAEHANRSTTRIRTSRLSPVSASCAAAACGHVMKSRVPSR
jgi:formate dehydrogenase major subunit